MPVTRSSLLAAAQSLCSSFASAASTSFLMSHFSSEATATEHGLPVLAPFIAHHPTFDAVSNYFDLLAKTLLIEDMKFSEWIVDTEELKVSVKGEALFVYRSTGKCWRETFAYTLDYAEEKQGLKVKQYQVWADTGAGEFWKLRKGTGRALIMGSVSSTDGEWVVGRLSDDCKEQRRNVILGNLQILQLLLDLHNLLPGVVCHRVLGAP